MDNNVIPLRDRDEKKFKEKLQGALQDALKEAVENKGIDSFILFIHYDNKTWDLVGSVHDVHKVTGILEQMKTWLLQIKD